MTCFVGIFSDKMVKKTRAQTQAKYAAWERAKESGGLWRRPGPKTARAEGQQEAYGDGGGEKGADKNSVIKKSQAVCPNDYQWCSHT